MLRRSVTCYWHLLRYHRPLQLARRAASHARRWLLRKTRGGRFARPLTIRPALRPCSQLPVVAARKLSNRRTPKALARGAAVRVGRFEFLNQEIALPDPVDWRLTAHAHVDPLWRFHLHYHEFLLDLAVAEEGDSASRARGWELVRHWIVTNPLDDPRTHADAWHPFCISRRVTAWIVFWQIAPPPDDLDSVIRESLFRQATFLAAHLERDLGGNHLLENAHALALAGSFFDGNDASEWLRIARNILRSELPEQILKHGEHFERSPMYHAQMLDALLDLRDALRDLDGGLARMCGETALRMARFLEQILHPDREIPLLGDSAFGESPPPDFLIRQAADAAPLCELSDSEGAGCRRIGDYWTWREGNDFLLFDGGPVGPDHLPAHAHSDLTTLEASIGGRRFVVDSGVFAYSADDLRRYCRSTAAHNVLQIDEGEQCDTWSRFRMGYRGRPSSIESGRGGDFDWARVRHNAFRRIGAPAVGRWVACRRGGPWLIVDWAEGGGSRWLANRLHLHPDIEVEEVSATMVHLRMGSERMRVGTLAPGKFELTDGIYCPEFGRKLAAPVLCWTRRVALPSACGWWFDRGVGSGTGSLSDSPFEGNVLHWRSASEQLAWQDAEIYGNRQADVAFRI